MVISEPFERVSLVAFLVKSEVVIIIPSTNSIMFEPSVSIICIFALLGIAFEMI